MLFLYLVFLGAALYWVAKILLPEMGKPSLPKPSKKSNPVSFEQSNDPDSRIKKLEILLAEKSKNIQLLQTELQIFLVQIREFDKVKAMLDEEIHHLREQNRMFRSELGIPLNASPAEQKETSIT